MTPTISVSDRVIVVKDDILDIDYKVGDVVVFYHPETHSNNSKTEKLIDSLQVWDSLFNGQNEIVYIKRIIGLPGDNIRIDKDGDIYRNDSLLIFNGLINETYSSISNYSVPDNQYFLLGDNRSNSQDSRVFGYVPIENLLGKAFYIVYPFNNFSNLYD